MTYLASDVVDVICVHDPHNMAELGGPASTVVEPGQVLRLLKNGYICLHMTDCVLSVL